MKARVEISSLQMIVDGTAEDVAFAVSELRKRPVGSVIDIDPDPVIFDTEFSATVFARSLRRFRKAQQLVREG